MSRRPEEHVRATLNNPSSVSRIPPVTISSLQNRSRCATWRDGMLVRETEELCVSEGNAGKRAGGGEGCMKLCQGVFKPK